MKIRLTLSEAWSRPASGCPLRAREGEDSQDILGRIEAELIEAENICLPGVSVVNMTLHCTLPILVKYL